MIRKFLNRCAILTDKCVDIFMIFFSAFGLSLLSDMNRKLNVKIKNIMIRKG